MRADQRADGQEVLSSNTPAPSTQAISISRRFRFKRAGLLAHGNVFDRSADQSSARRRSAAPLHLLPGRENDAFRIEDVVFDLMFGVVDQQAPGDGSSSRRPPRTGSRRRTDCPASGQAVLEGPHVVDFPLSFAPRGQQAGLAHDDQVALGRQMGRNVRASMTLWIGCKNSGWNLYEVGGSTCDHSTSP